MWHLDFSQWQNAGDIRDIFIANYNIQAKWENTLDRTFTRDNVQVNNGVLSVSVTNGPGKAMRCGGFGTQRTDLLYGSFRANIRMPSINGTVAAMYMYNPEQEIDIETLSSVSPHQSYFAVHPGLLEDGHASHLTHDNHWLGFDPSQDYHEYRFDWLKDAVVFYIDGVEAHRMVTNVPNLPGRLMFNHWSDGNPNFSQGPPTEDTSMDVKNITAFFNYTVTDSITGQNAIATPQCKRTQQACNVANILNNLSDPPPVDKSIDSSQSLSSPAAASSLPADITNAPVLQKSLASVSEPSILSTLLLFLTGLLSLY
ncbi:concanavalin A-like lectin/glucanase domain-containing protein [Syncephalastrum racemosum]|uniref:Concanavalin A-like lectin/glucanase domain-containing protein n=1 Tax=Syncephalastrum racemosum TaxID=13706 RepID=A0A1X2HXZ8_SYNRA|nr:concanavalin A-like lectin/glucanase domain-containing protein [Syncephalastrum racemosum]